MYFSYSVLSVPQSALCFLFVRGSELRNDGPRNPATPGNSSAPARFVSMAEACSASSPRPSGIEAFPAMITAGSNSPTIVFC